jgi:hypothetical protein
VIHLSLMTLTRQRFIGQPSESLVVPTYFTSIKSPVSTSALHAKSTVAQWIIESRTFGRNIGVQTNSSSMSRCRSVRVLVSFEPITKSD